MSNQNLRYLFLHLGPGGNSGLERLWLQDYRSRVDFWDQPTNISSFDELVQHCNDRFKSETYKGIIGHSFGCELALEISRRSSSPIELYFISPLHNIPIAFINLARSLTKDIALSVDRKRQLNEAAQKMKSSIDQQLGQNLSPVEIEHFMRLVMTIGADPKYSKAFWNQSEKFSAFEKELPKLSLLDQTCWKNVMTDFLMNYQSSTHQQVNAKIFIGTQDPYIGSIHEEKKYWENLGSQFFSIEKSGHYPHLESNAFKLIVKPT